MFGAKLLHYGIKGQKWGIRRYQNKDGSLTTEGRQHYKQNTVFISGSSKTQDLSSNYYRETLPKEILSKIDGFISSKSNIVVGDAPGIDRQVQDYLNEKNYDRVVVYGPGTAVRYLANSSWKSKPIDAPEFEPGSKEWLAKKDIEMEKKATSGLAVVLDEGAAATRRNIERLVNNGKSVSVYELSKNGTKYDHWW